MRLGLSSDISRRPAVFDLHAPFTVSRLLVRAEDGQLLRLNGRKREIWGRQGATCLPARSGVGV